MPTLEKLIDAQARGAACNTPLDELRSNQSGTAMELINPIDYSALKRQIESAKPFPYFCVDNFLNNEFADEIYNSFPTFHDAKSMGREFDSVNEKRKIQITNAALFPSAIARLNQLLASPEFVSSMSEVFGIPRLLADGDLVGGGIHETNGGGRLDVHVDFNFVEKKQWHRRLNILIYFNKDWPKQYGGNLEFWDSDVKKCHASFAPVFNRACGFATSDISFHGVTPLTCPPTIMRRSFATYYYTKEAPAGWNGDKHSTIFKARPDEWMRGTVFMPAEDSARWARRGIRKVKGAIKSLLGK
jgi:Rps23 Pro-64 3,4-dihydroxylase Tpa1-like proline 4-hydroxylase